MAQLITHPQVTYLLRVRGLSMIDAGLGDDDTIIVDRDQACQWTYRCHCGRRRIYGEVLAVVRPPHQVEDGKPTYPDIVPEDGQTGEV